MRKAHARTINWRQRMSAKNQKILRLVYSIVLSVLTITAGIILIVQSQRIYHSPGGYSREIVSEYLGDISAVLYIWIALVAIGAILWQIFPPEQKKLRATIYQTNTLKKLQSRFPYLESEKLRHARIVKNVVLYTTIAFVILAIVMVGIVVWNSDNYRPAGNGFNPMQDMLDMLPKFLPWVICAFVVMIAATVYFEISAKQEVSEMKRLIAEAKNNTEKPLENTQKNKTSLWKKMYDKIPKVLKTENFKRYSLLGTRIALAVVAVVFIIVGALNGGLQAVLEKAINICRECIGLG